MQPQSRILASSVPDACKRIGIGRTLMYELVARGEVRVIKIGARCLVPESELERLVSSRLAAACKDAAA